jgi:acetyl-CoA carboxylase biotin carboxyl carrier protein
MGGLKLIVGKGNKGNIIGENDLQTEEGTPSLSPRELTMASKNMEAALEPIVPSKNRPVEMAESIKEGKYFPIKAPMLGTFYRTPKPGAPPFVEVGQFVTEDDVVCIIEIMKLFNTVKAGVRGRIAKICVEQAQMVEFQQPLSLVEKVSEDDSKGAANSACN